MMVDCDEMMVDGDEMKSCYEIVVFFQFLELDIPI